MRDNFDYKKIGKGMYKVAFTLCIFVLCIITVVITGNYEKSATTDLKIEDFENETVIPSENIEEYEKSKEAKESIISEKNNEISEDVSEVVEYIPDFIPPVPGDVLKDFSGTIPIYNKTMDDWRIHTGIDILCPYGTAVTASEKGTVTDVGYDMLWGNYVEVSLNDFILRYTSLESGIMHMVGDEVRKGDIIGYLSDSCVSEICDEPHFHFEMKKSGEYVDPGEYIYKG